MEMDSAELNDDDCIEDPYAEMLYSPNFSLNGDIFRDPEVLPRVGDEYQVEIPPIMPVSDYIRLTENPTGVETMDSLPHKFVMGLPMSIMPVKQEVQEIKNESQECLCVSNDLYNKIGATESGKIIDKVKSSGFKVEPERVIEKGECSGIKVEYSDSGLDRKTGLGESTGLAMQQEMKNEVHLQCAVSLGKPWSNTEEAIFLLGVYIFGKSFDQVKRFIECKRMGDILLFYYGRFYGSNRYHKWKKKCKRRMYGTKIFTGLRQKELLSRLLPRSSEDCHHNMLEVSKTFGEGSISLEEYVFTLKSMAGMNNLIEAVGLGKKKQDLTRITRESLRSSQGFPVRAEIPIGKACSALTAEDIIKFLTGDFRLSKARSSDLFWEAVWPRLLARGWHSEQPMDRSYAAGSKHSLVFLMPDVKKFSRRKLVKGDHYFDSVTDVLSKVASEPGLLWIEADKGNDIKEEYGLTDDEKLDQDNFSDQQRHRYLQPRMPNRSADLANITVIDTSLAYGEKVKVRELRCLQVETLNTSPTRSHSEEIGSDSSEEATNESDPANSSYFNQEDTNVSKRRKIMLDEELSSDRKDADCIRSNQGFLMNGSSSAVLPEKISMDQNTKMCNDIQPRKPRKYQSSQKTRLENSIFLTPVFQRRRRLSACSRTETNHRSNGFLTSPGLKQKEAHDCLDNPDASNNILSPVDPSQELPPTNSWAKSSLIVNSEGYTGNGCLGAEYSHEKPQVKMLFDLNIVVAPDAEMDEPFMTEVAERQEDQTSKHQDDPNALDTAAGVARSEQDPNMNSRRQSTRNRPLTTKALEALANGYLSIKQRRKRGKAFPQENSVSRHSRCARGRVKVSKNCSTGSGESKLEEEGNEVCASTGAMFSEFQVQSEGKGAQVSAI